MELVLGKTYKSPTNGRFIRILTIRIISNTVVCLEVLLIDKDTLEITPDTLYVDRSDLHSWGEVLVNV